MSISANEFTASRSTPSMMPSNSGLVTALKDEGKLLVNTHPSKSVRIYVSPEGFIVVVSVSERLRSRPVSKGTTCIG